MPEYDTNADSYRHWSEGESIYWTIEQTSFFEVLGSVRDLNILELACGEGRLSRMLIERDARSLLATDISEEMIKRAIEQNTNTQGGRLHSTLAYQVVDATDEEFTLDEPVDLVAAMYLFHYADSEESLARMGRLISRNLKPGGRLVAYTVNPDYDFTREDPRLQEYFDFEIHPIEPPRFQLVLGKLAVTIWQWSREAHERALTAAGMANVRWHPLHMPDSQRETARTVQWYLDDPSCIVVSAEKPL